MKHNQNTIVAISHSCAIRFMTIHDLFLSAAEKTARCREVKLAVGDML